MRLASVLCIALLLSGCGMAHTVPDTFGTAAAEAALLPDAVPRPDHVVIVVEENKAYSQIVGNTQAPYINQLAYEGASFKQAYAEAHPSQANYLALFSGSMHGVESDRCLDTLSGPNLASELENSGYNFAIFSQSLPEAGFSGCRQGAYARKHNPVVDWQGVNVEPKRNQPFGAFPRNFDDLPTVALVVPDLDHDMHDGSIAEGDRWLERHLGAYRKWAATHNSLLIVTWDEDSSWRDNHIPTMVVGDGVKPGQYDRQINHYSLLRTLEAMYGLKPLGQSAQAVPITGIWK